MAAYIIANIDVTDPDLYEDYKRQVPPTLAGYDAEFLTRGGAMEVLEGEAYPRVVIIRFANVDDAREWYNSAAYQTAKAIRNRASTGNLLLVEGN